MTLQCLFVFSCFDIRVNIWQHFYFVNSVVLSEAVSEHHSFCSYYHNRLKQQALDLCQYCCQMATYAKSTFVLIQIITLLLLRSTCLFKDSNEVTSAFMFKQMNNSIPDFHLESLYPGTAQFELNQERKSASGCLENGIFFLQERLLFEISEKLSIWRCLIMYLPCSIRSWVQSLTL